MNRVSLIVAVGEDYAIGHNNNLLWSIKDDLRIFMRTTSQHVVVHGRKSYESIGKPLKNRTNIIITRNKDYHAESCFVANSIDAAIAIGQRLEQQGELFILGGAQIYEQSLDKVDRMYISHVKGSFPKADAHFPKPDFTKWKKTLVSSYMADDRNEFGFDFCIYDRI